MQVLCNCDAIQLPADAANALAVIVNEFTANSFKHAFPPDSRGIVSISLKREDEAVVLECRDSGSGGTPSPDKGGDGIGKRLMEAAGEQLGGTLALGPTSDGYQLRLVIPRLPEAKAADRQDAVSVA